MANRSQNEPDALHAGLRSALAYRVNRRSLLAGSLALGLTGFLAACGSDDDDEPTATSEAGDASGDSTEAADASGDTTGNNGDVREVETMHGMVEVPASPQRIVLLNYDDTGAEVMSLLEIPVLGIHRPPVNRPEIPLTGELNELGEEDLDIEAVAALQPDLITGMYRSVYADALDALRQIAPVALLDGEAALEWREVTLGLGDIVNREDDAQALIDETEVRIEEVRENIDTSKSVVVVRPNPDGQFRAYTEESFPGLILSELGISIPQEFREIEDAEGTAAARGWNTLSPERVGELDAADVVILWAFGAEPEELVAVFLENPLWDLLSVAQEDRYYIGGRGWYGAGPIAVRESLNDVEAALSEAS